MKSKLLKVYYKVRTSFLWFFSIVIFKLKFPFLKQNIVYGFSKDLVLVDQLASPNPSLVESNYGPINDIDAAKRFGTADLKEYSFWSWRSCGVANVASILKTLNLFDGSLYNLICEIKDADGYLFEDKYGNKDIGWKHAALVDAFKRRGLNSTILRKVSVEKVLLEVMSGHLVIASVKSMLIDGGSHMIVIKSFTKSDSGLVLNIYNPYNLNGKGGNITISIDEFKKIFLNKGINVLI